MITLSYFKKMSNMITRKSQKESRFSIQNVVGKKPKYITFKVDFDDQPPFELAI